MMASIAEVEQTWRSVTAQTLRLLEELEAGQETTDASYIFSCMRSIERGSKERFGLRLLFIRGRRFDRVVVSQHSTRAPGKRPKTPCLI